MFCLMDVSASMGEREKDLAKRFFILLHLFLKRKYDTVEIVFIRHTHEANEVDEQTFFHGRETGGTVVSSALKKMIEITRKRYPPDRLEHLLRPGVRRRQFERRHRSLCVEMLADVILPLTQYYAYIEIGEPHPGRRHVVLRVRQGTLARLCRNGEEPAQFRHASRARPRRHLSRLSPIVREDEAGRGSEMTLA